MGLWLLAEGSGSRNIFAILNSLLFSQEQETLLIRRDILISQLIPKWPLSSRILDSEAHHKLERWLIESLVWVASGLQTYPARPGLVSLTIWSSNWRRLGVILIYIPNLSYLITHHYSRLSPWFRLVHLRPSDFRGRMYATSKTG